VKSLKARRAAPACATNLNPGVSLGIEIDVTAAAIAIVRIAVDLHRFRRNRRPLR
jgi:hypothetical protein